MASDETKRRHIGRAEKVKPEFDNPVVGILGAYGIPYDRITGLCSKGNEFTGEEKFEDYKVYIFGVSSDESLPHPQLSWYSEEGKEYACWQIQIYWKNYYGRVDSVWWKEYDHYTVMTVWGSLGQLDKQIENALNKGLELLRVIAQLMTEVKRGGAHNVKVANQPEHIKKLWVLDT